MYSSQIQCMPHAYKQGAVPISNWSEDDQPREKLLSKGRSILSDAELIAILLRSGTNRKSAVGLAQEVLNTADKDLNRLARMGVRELTTLPGMGLAKAASIVAAMELGRRRKSSETAKKVRIRSSKDVYELIKDVFYDLHHEEFWIVLLSRSNDVISKKKISQGGVSGTVADNKLIFKSALEELASSLVVCHNHPSGNLTPSKADEELTKKIKRAASDLDIALLDHLILHNEHYFSFADEGLL